MVEFNDVRTANGQQASKVKDLKIDTHKIALMLQSPSDSCLV